MASACERTNVGKIKRGFSQPEVGVTRMKDSDGQNISRIQTGFVSQEVRSELATVQCFEFATAKSQSYGLSKNFEQITTIASRLICKKKNLRSHRKISAAELEQAKLLKKAGMNTSEIWNLFVHQNGGWDKVGCTKKDLYNSLAAGQRGVDDLDANTTHTFLQSKLDIDPEFFLRIHGR